MKESQVSLLAIVALVLGALALVFWVLLYPALTGRLSITEESIQQQETRLRHVGDTMEAIPEDLDEFRDLMASVEGRLLNLEQLDQDVASLEERFSETDGIVESLAENMSQLQARVLRGEETAVAIQDQLIIQEDRLHSLEENFLSQQDIMSIHSQQIVELTLSIEEVVMASGGLSEQIGLLEENVSDLSQRVLIGDQRIDGLEELLDNVLVVTEVLTEEIETLRGEMDSLSIDVRFQAVLNYVDVIVADIRKNIEEARSEIATTLQEASSERDEFRVKLEVLGESLGSQRIALQEVMDNLQNEVDNLRNQLIEEKESMTEELSLIREEVSEDIQHFEELVQEIALVAEEALTPDELAELSETLMAEMSRFRDEMTALRERTNERSSELEAKLEEALRSLEALDEEVDDLSALQGERFEELQTIQQAVRSEMTEMADRVTAFEEEISRAFASEEQLWDGIEEQREVVERLERSLGSLDIDLRTMFFSIEERIESISEEIEVLPGDLTQQVEEKLGHLLEDIPDQVALENIRVALAEAGRERAQLASEIEELAKEREELMERLTLKDQAIVEVRQRIEILEEEVDIPIEDIEKLQGQLEDLVASRDMLDERLQDAEISLSELRVSLDVLEGTWQGFTELMDTQITQIRESVIAVRDELLEEVVSDEVVVSLHQEVEQSLEQVEERLASLEVFSHDIGRIDLESKIEAMEGKIKTLETHVEAMLERFDQVTFPEIEAVMDSLENLQQERQEIQKNIEDLYQHLERHEIAELTGAELDLLDQQKEELVEQIEGLGDEKQILQRELDARREEVALIDEEIERLRGAREHEIEVSELERERERIEREAARLERELVNRLRQIELLQQRVQELTMQLEEVSKYTSYVILPWDNLWNIARRYYQDGTKWEVILEANKDIIDDVHNLQPYTEIRIPRQVAANL